MQRTLIGSAFVIVSAPAMKRALLASASALCATLIWVSIGAAQFNPNAPTPTMPTQPGLMVPSPGNTNIGIPSQNIPQPTVRDESNTESKKKKDQAGGGKDKASNVTGRGKAAPAAGTQSGVKAPTLGLGISVPASSAGTDASRPLGQRVRESPPQTPGSTGGATPDSAEKPNLFQHPGPVGPQQGNTNIGVPPQNIPGARDATKSEDDASKKTGPALGSKVLDEGATGTDAARISPLPRAIPGVGAVPNTLPLPGGRDEPTRERDAGPGQPPAQDAGVGSAKRGSSRPDAILTGNQVPVPAGLEELLKLFGGNLNAVDQLKELVEMLRHGPNVAADPLFGGRGRDAADPLGNLPFGSNPNDEANRKADSGWNPFGGPSSPAATSGYGGRVGWASTGGMQWGTPKRWRQDDGTEVTESHGSSENLGMSIWRRDERNSDGSGDSIEIVIRHGSPEVRREVRGAPYVEGGMLLQKYDRWAYRQAENSPANDRYWEHGTEEISSGATARAEKDAVPYFYDSGPKPEEDSMPSEEGYGRYTGPVVCPLGGCRDEDRRPRIYVNPGPEGPDGPGSRPANVAESRPRLGPGAATDPNPDDIGSGSGGGGASRPDPCRYAQGPSCGDAEPGTPSGPPLR